MKITKTVLDSMEKDIRVYMNHLDIDPINMSVNDLNNVWFNVFMNRSYPTSNPNLKTINGERLLPQIADFELYPCNTNDTTLYTALHMILKNLQDKKRCEVCHCLNGTHSSYCPGNPINFDLYTYQTSQI